MANTNSPFGFRLHGLGGDAVDPTVGLKMVKIASTNTNQFGEGDPIKQLNTGYVDAFTNGAGGNALVGIFHHCEYYSTSAGRKVWKNYWPGTDATGDVWCYVNPCLGAPAPRFVVQSAGATAVTLASVGTNTDILTGSATTGSVTGGFYRSACTIDLVTNFATTASLPFRIVGLWGSTDHSAPGIPGAAGADNSTIYNWVLVEANNSGITGV
jgi:hypothetical protein